MKYPFKYLAFVLCHYGKEKKSTYNYFNRVVDKLQIYLLINYAYIYSNKKIKRVTVVVTGTTILIIIMQSKVLPFKH